MTRDNDEFPGIPGVEILSLISTGGMGDVLLARRVGAHGFEKLIAVKTIRPELARSKDIRAMFLDEAKLVARLNHPNIAHVYDFGEEKGALYLTMEYVPGLSFGQLVKKREGPLPPLIAAQLVSNVLRGLHAAHELTDLNGQPMGVVHRDVSPDNLILTFDGRVKILDFGIALVRDRETPVTEVGSLKGKPAYMAPERLRGEPVDRRTDIYSTSVVLHELITGEKLFSRGSMIATALAVEGEPVPKPSSVIGPLPGNLEEIIMRGLDRNPEHRFDDARSMAAALDEIVRAGEEATLDAFVDAELDDDRDRHRSGLHAILDGLGAERQQASSKQKGPIAISAREALEPSISPLADATTLVPVIDPPEPQESVSVWRAAMIALAIIVLPVLTVLLLLSERPPTTVGQLPIPEPPDEPPTAEVILPSDDLPPVGHPEAGSAPKAKTKPKSKRGRKRPSKLKKKTKTKPIEVEEPVTFGFVTIGASPYARIRIDGEEVGVTPVVNHKLPAGPHEIEFLRPDTGELRDKRTIKLTDQEHRRITIP